MAKDPPAELFPAYDLLKTKYSIPLLGAKIITRKRLTDLLRSIPEKRVTLIVCPAGYGKTTLLSDWLSTGKLPGQRPAWFSLDSTDNSPIRFWSYVASALQRAHPSFRIGPQYFQQRYNSQDRAQLNPLINEIARIPFQVCLVLDDYQVIVNEQIHLDLEYLIEHQPENFHLILSSRIAPPISLTRLRANKQLLELTVENLSFTTSEAENFLSDVMGLNLQPEQIAKLLKATEGWITGLQLAALSLQSRRDFKRLIDEFPIGPIHILEYLSEEVLNHQDEVSRDFLIKTSILSDLSAPLCDALLDRNDSQKFLLQIEQSNLFATYLDYDRYWLRYHPLFAGTLKVHLERTYPALIPHLHRKACAWLRENGHFDRAVVHALAAGETEIAVEVINTCAMRAITNFDLVNLIQWISRFPFELIARRPSLGIYYCLAAYFLGRIDLVKKELQIIQQLLEKAQKSTAPYEKEALLCWQVRAFQAVIDCVVGNPDQGISHTLAVLNSASQSDNYFLGFLHHYLAYAYQSAGKLEAACEAFDQGCQWAIAHNLPLEYACSRCEIARIRKDQGRLREAEQEFRRALDIARQNNLPISVIALAESGLGEIALERNELQAAHEWMRESSLYLSNVEPNTQAWFVSANLCSRLMKYYLAIQDCDNASSLYLKTKKYLSESCQVNINLFAGIIDTQVWFGIKRGDLQEAEKDLAELSFLNVAGTTNLAEQAATARILLAQNKALEVLPILLGLVASAQTIGSAERVIDALTLLALAYHINGDDVTALQTLQKALEIAEPEGYIRIFVENGEPIKILLGKYSSSLKEDQPGSKKDATRFYVRRLLAEFDTNGNKKIGALDESKSQATLSTPDLDLLTSRELEVYQLLESGKTPKEIATSLVISINTVKAHLKSIYKKLDAHTRKEIVQRTRSMD